jgi:hypothetical protein
VARNASRAFDTSFKRTIECVYKVDRREKRARFVKSTWSEVISRSRVCAYVRARARKGERGRAESSGVLFADYFESV